ncbi:MAG: glycosyltransferase family 2 protein [Muribaculaceae bacterium]|nr:glycosyltransferase family 2 protein [Muribaculaceae bacterium]
MINLSIIILTWNNIDATRRCLKSLEPVMSRDDVETIVIDNASTDGTQSAIRREFPQVRLTCNGTNRGIAAARNQGFMRASGRKLLILDNDTVVNSLAVEGMERYLDEHNDVGLCACCMTDAQGNVQPSFRPFPGLISKVYSILRIQRPLSHYKADEDGSIEPFYVIGACQMIKREAVGQIGMLDEAIFYGPEDADYCLRLRKAGWRIKYLPMYSIVHTYQRATARNPFSWLGLKHVRGLLHLYTKYRRLN